MRDSGDYSGSVENSKRMFAFILAAKAQVRKIRLGYNDADGPACRLAQVGVQW